MVVISEALHVASTVIKDVKCLAFFTCKCVSLSLLMNCYAYIVVVVFLQCNIFIYT